ncbi:hypothetical protein BDV19DRAFT_373924 [Aspergillus venezuelensis]
MIPFAIVANYYLVEVSPTDSSTELWVGSHRDTSFADHRNCTGTFDEAEFGIRNELLERRRKWAPPIQPAVKKGSVVLRDLRLWHAGSSNPSSEHRIMLAWVYTPRWYNLPSVICSSTRSRAHDCFDGPFLGCIEIAKFMDDLSVGGVERNA